MYDKLAFNMMMDSIPGWFFILKKEKLPKDIKEAIKDYDVPSIRLVRNAIEEGVETEKIMEFCKPCFCYEQMLQVFKGFRNGLSIEQVRTYAKECFESKSMQYIRETIEAGVDLEYIKEFTKPRYNAVQRFEILRALKLGIPVEQIREFADPSISEKYMSICVTKYALINGIIPEEDESTFYDMKRRIEKMLNE